MARRNTLAQLLIESAQRDPDQIAIQDPGVGEMTYRALAQLSDRVRDYLVQLDVRPGDRVGVYLPKSIDTLAAIFGILKAGAAYVPVDVYAPAARGAYILNDCAVKAVFVEPYFVNALLPELTSLGRVPELLPVDTTRGGEGIHRTLDQVPAPVTKSVMSDENDLAYILYTSGSTGRPKGVMLSQRNALAFVNWCSETFAPQKTDRFSSHAPFHFDLSILDIYLAIKHGATLVLVNAETGKDPGRLAQLIADARISIWYSTPSILSLLAQYGKLTRYDYSNLRMILFAGEVFPVRHLSTLKALIPHPRYFNLYGPTETNVCTYYEIPQQIEPERSIPFPIGKACSHYNVKAVDEQGIHVAPGEEGELVAAGPGVMSGYWNLPERTERAFLYDQDGTRWYKTGDVVVEESDGNYRYVSRRDRMVKRLGYRIELGEIESGLYRHPSVKEAAVVARPDQDNGVRIIAFLSCRNEQKPSTIELKRFCRETLPAYMIPDLFVIYDSLPKTSTDKTDYQALMQSQVLGGQA